MVLGRFPRLKLYSFVPEGMSKTRMTVPVVEAVASRVPELQREQSAHSTQTAIHGLPAELHFYDSAFVRFYFL